MTSPLLQFRQTVPAEPITILPRGARRPVRVVHHIYQPKRCELAMAALQPLVDDWDMAAWEEVSRLENCRCGTPLSRWCLANSGLAARVLAGDFGPEAA